MAKKHKYLIMTNDLTLTLILTQPYSYINTDVYLLVVLSWESTDLVPRRILAVFSGKASEDQIVVTNKNKRKGKKIEREYIIHISNKRP